MRLLITGGGGQLAKSTIPLLAPDHTLEVFDKQTLNITDTDLLDSTLLRVRPDYVLNFAAYNQILAKAEENCDRVNHQAIEQLAILTNRYQMGLIHISTNYVFSGKHYRLHNEADHTEPLSHYGWSKYQGEQAILNHHKSAVIIRTSSLFSAKGRNFITKILTQIRNNQVLSIVDDAMTQPTSCHDLALFMQYLLTNKHTLSGVIHFSGETICSWYQYAQLIAQEYLSLYPKTNIRLVSRSSPMPNIRPSYALLDNTFRKQWYPSENTALLRPQVKAVIRDLANAGEWFS